MPFCVTSILVTGLALVGETEKFTLTSLSPRPDASITAWLGTLIATPVAVTETGPSRTGPIAYTL